MKNVFGLLFITVSEFNMKLTSQKRYFSKITKSCVVKINFM